VNEQAVSFDRDAVIRRWLASTLGSYPSLSLRFLSGERDRFRNPVGHAVREALPVLLEELLGGMNEERISPMLDQIVRMRAVQDFTASQAVGFVFSLKDAVRQEDPAGLTPQLERRIDQMALLAFDLFVACRDRMNEIKLSEARRSTYLLDRVRASQPDGEMR
jgi:hypothetical protein